MRMDIWKDLWKADDWDEKMVVPMAVVTVGEMVGEMDDEWA